MRILLLAVLLAQGQPTIPISATQSGVNGENLSDSPVTDAINMEATRATNQLAWTFKLTPGTTTAVTVTCEESDVSATAGFGPVQVCVGSVCEPDERTFTLADITADADSKKWLDSAWHIVKKWARCKITGTGSGTVIATGSRSWQ